VVDLSHSPRTTDASRAGSGDAAHGAEDAAGAVFVVAVVDVVGGDAGVVELVALVGCPVVGAGLVVDTDGPADSVPPSPLPARDASVVLGEWDKSTTRTDCPPLGFAALGDGTGGVARPADFGTTSWAVAWDKAGSPGQLPSGEFSPIAGRSTFGIAGVGGLPDSTFTWPYRIDWSDGSSAGYGVEGGGAFVVDGSTTKWLSHLRLDGHPCLYNVWSNLGRNHLEYLLGQLRSVEGHPL